MKTRDKILVKSQELFNKNGISKVSIRNICEELNISLGNFTYHFPDKKKIVIDLYHKMIGEMEAIAGKVTASKESIIFLLEYHKHIFRIQNSYKFFYLNTFELVHNSAEIRKAFLLHMEKEKMMMKEMLQFYITKGVIKKNTNLHFLDKLIHMNLMVNNFWIIDAELQFKGKNNKRVLYYLELCCSLIEPHLTRDALQDYNEYLSIVEKQ